MTKKIFSKMAQKGSTAWYKEMAAKLNSVTVELRRARIIPHVKKFLYTGKESWLHLYPLTEKDVWPGDSVVAAGVAMSSKQFYQEYCVTFDGVNSKKPHITEVQKHFFDFVDRANKEGKNIALNMNRIRRH